MSKESAEELRWAKEVRRQYKVAEDNIVPREQKYFDNLKK